MKNGLTTGSVRTRSVCTAIGSLAALALGVPALGQIASAETSELELGPLPTPTTNPPTPATPTPAVAEPKPGETGKLGSRWHITLGVEYVSAYYSRGYRQEDHGFIAQPSGSLALDLFEEGEFSMVADLALFSSFHDNPGAATSNDRVTKHWFEQDIGGGLTFKYDKHALRAAYVTYTGPSGALTTIDEVDLTYSFDDSELLGEWALSPTATLVIETTDAGSDGTTTGHGLYLELGIAPGFELEKIGIDVIKGATVKFPILVGLSVSDYYENARNKDQTFGMLDAGAKLFIPLPLDDSYGKWTLTTGIRLLWLGDAAQTFNRDQREFEVIGSVGLNVSF